MAVSQKVRARRARLQPAPPVRAKATLVYSPHPLLVDAGRVIAHTAAIEGESLAQYLRRHGVDTAGPLVVTVNAREVARDEWELLPAEAGQLVTARGAAANDGGSNPLRLVALIALAVAAPWAGGYIASSMFGGAVLGGTMGSAGLALATSVAAGVVTVAGSMLLNRLFPPPKMDLGRGMSEPKASPTYSIAGGQNRARPYEPMPLVLGTHRVFFDLAAKPYTVFEGEDQYLYQVFCVGMVGPHGALDVSDLRIGDTPLASYAEVSTQSSVGSLPSMMPANVDTVAGGELSFSGGPLVRTTSAGTTRIEIDLSAVAFEARDDGTLGPFAIDFVAEYRPAGSSAAWQTLVSASTTGNKTAPVRLTYGVAVVVGSYEVRVTRSSQDSPSDRITADLQWAALKSYQPDDGYYEGQQFLAVKIRATGQLQGVVDRLSGVVRMPTAPGIYSSSPADLFRLFAVGHKAVDGRALWGGQLSASALDTAGLAAWGAWCASKGLAFNGVIDAQRSVWDVLQGIARCGRASPTWASGTLGVVWDADNQAVVANFGMSNIRRGTFEVAYQSEDPVDEVVLSYIDAANGYQPDQVRAVAPGVAVPSKSASIELWGCTSQAQAVKECYLALAENLYRTRLVSWETDMEGLVVTRGDVVSLSHDLTQWGTSGRLVSGTATQVVLDRPISVTSGGTWIGLVSPDGAQYVCRVANASGQHSAISLLDALPVAPDADNPIDWRYTADYLATPGKLVKIVSVVPTGMHSVKLQAVDEYDEYYAAESGSYTPPARRPWASSQPQIRALGVTEEAVRSGGGYVTRLAVTWSESGGVASRLVRYSIDGGPLTVAGYADSARFELTVPDAGTVLIVVTLYDGAGQTSSAAQASVSHTLAGIAYAPLALTSLVAVGELFQIRLSWGFSGDVNDVKHVELWGSSTNNRGGATLLSTVAAPSNGWLHTGLPPGDVRFYWARVVDARNRPSDWLPSGIAAGASAAVSSDPSAILDALTGSITEDALYQDLSARIDLIDTPTTGALAQISGLQSQFGALQAEVADLSLTPDYDPAATYDAEDIAKYGGALYRALQTTTGNLPTNVTYWAKIGDYASIGAAVGALAADVSDLDTRVDATETGLASEVTARRTLAAQLTGYQDPTGKTLAQITSGLVGEEKSARAAEDGALAQSLSTVSSTVDGHTSSIQTNSTSINGIQAKYTVKIDNNGYVSGYGLISTANNGAPSSTFTILADRFQVVTPGLSAQVPFVIGAVNGATAVGINGALAVDGSIAARSIDTRGLTVKDANGAVILSSGVPLDWSRVGSKPTSLAGINSVEGNKLAGIAAGADVTGQNTAAGIVNQGAFATVSKIESWNAGNLLGNSIISNAMITGDIFSGAWDWNNGWYLQRNGNLYAANAYIRGDIEASSLKANTAMVNTLHINGNAVTVPVTYTSSATVALAYNTWTTVGSAYINPEGAVVFVHAFAQFSNNDSNSAPMFMRVVSPSGAVISAAGPAVTSTMNWGAGTATRSGSVILSGAFIETGTYTLQMNSGNANYSAHHRALLLLAGKR